VLSEEMTDASDDIRRFGFLNNTKQRPPGPFGRGTVADFKHDRRWHALGLSPPADEDRKLGVTDPVDLAPPTPKIAIGVAAADISIAKLLSKWSKPGTYS
jgi:hypothetical protein